MILVFKLVHQEQPPRPEVDPRTGKVTHVAVPDVYAVKLVGNYDDDFDLRQLGEGDYRVLEAGEEITDDDFATPTQFNLRMPDVRVRIPSSKPKLETI